MSDLHGNYKAYLSMLGKIKFRENDRLYILGDILDRGPNPFKLLLDLMERPNVKVLIGNHEVMAYECLAFLLKEITAENLSEISEDVIEKLLNWQQNGGLSTTDEFHKYDRETQKKAVEWITDLELYDEIEIAGKTFLFVHAGLGNFAPEKELWEYELDELVWKSPDYDERYYTDKYVITGHTPTALIEGNERPNHIYQANGHIAIDCGCSFPDGRLGCLRLEDMKEFYIEQDDKQA